MWSTIRTRSSPPATGDLCHQELAFLWGTVNSTTCLPLKLAHQRRMLPKTFQHIRPLNFHADPQALASRFTNFSFIAWHYWRAGVGVGLQKLHKHDAPKKSRFADEIRRTANVRVGKVIRRWCGSSGYVRLSRLLMSFLYLLLQPYALCLNQYCTLCSEKNIHLYFLA